MTKKETFTKSIQLRVNEGFLDNIDSWLTDRNLKWSRSEAIRYLVMRGISSESYDGMAGISDRLGEFKKTVRNLTDHSGKGPPNNEVMTQFLQALTSINSLEEGINNEIENKDLLRKQIRKMRTQVTYILNKEFDSLQ